MLPNLLNKILFKLHSILKTSTNISIEEGYGIAKNTNLVNASLYGKVSVEEGSKIRNGVKIKAIAPITIGRYSSINGPGTEVNACINQIKIGSFCSIAKGVTIIEYNHDYKRLASYYVFQNIIDGNVRNDIVSKGDIVIGNDVWIGVNATILSGVTIGNGAIVAANSVVIEDVPPFAIVGGNPAKVIKMRFDNNTISEILEMAWWNWSIEKIKENKSLFSGKYN